jgi:hypothetical protein
MPIPQNRGHDYEKKIVYYQKSSADQVTFLETIPDIRLTSAVGLTDIALSA